MTETVLITGASSGLGEEYAFQLADSGFDLIITARRESRLNELAMTLEKDYDTSVTVIPADLTKKNDLDQLGEVIENTDDLTLLVNNAGFGVPKPFLEIDLSRHQAMIDVHVTAVVKLSYIAMQKFMGQNKGSIITVSSMAAFMGSGMYSGTKRFQLTFSKRLAKIARETPIRIQVLCPGYVKTGFHYTEDYEGKDVKSRIPSWLWMDRDYVVRYSLEKLEKGKLVVIPSIKYKIIKILGSLGLISRR